MKSLLRSLKSAQAAGCGTKRMRDSADLAASGESVVREFVKSADYSSVAWHESLCLKGVRFAVRRPSLAQRLDLTARVRELTLKHEFLRAGNEADQLSASLSELLVRKLYVDWGLEEIEGLNIDGSAASTVSLIERGPEELVEEVVGAVRAEAGLTEDERKNS